MKIIDSVQDAVQQVAAFEGQASDFRLTISQQLLDPVGINMAIITDHVLKRGWEPDSFLQGDGFRTYRYKNME
ncbi:hypothetical protein [Dyella tabacisoli]|uniref:Uncharacterized protein n=1 Tax=Dyella tabacisoli TaxID=2282381 RepID=A0A369UTA0_9GAMM|nr:hypothetical protein [Dyella tabacisoli]RDD83543.1 hypothetical protein DVJ77_02915 [Dyella tabacisoli]